MAVQFKPNEAEEAGPGKSVWLTSWHAATRMKGYSASSRRSLNDLTRASSPAHSALTIDLEKLAPHSSSVIAVTWRVDTLCTTIAIRASTNACSLL